MLTACSDTGTAERAKTTDVSGNTPAVTDNNDLYFAKQEIKPSPEWVKNLDVAKDENNKQFIIVAGVDKSTAYITMHERNDKGEWEQIIATPGFIGLQGLGTANIEETYTPIGTFTIDKTFGLAPDPGCQMEYTQVSEEAYWCGDSRDGMPFNKLININDYPNVDTEECEHIADYDYAYRYVLNMGYNSENIPQNGFAFFLHSFRVNRPYTGGCVAVPESVMKFIMQHIKDGCKIKLDYLDAMGGDLDA